MGSAASRLYKGDVIRVNGREASVNSVDYQGYLDYPQDTPVRYPCKIQDKIHR